MKKFLIFLLILAIAGGIIWLIQPPWLQDFTSTWIKPNKLDTEPSPGGMFYATYYITGNNDADAKTCVNLTNNGEKFRPFTGIVYQSKGRKRLTLHWVSDMMLHIDIDVESSDNYQVNFDGVAIEFHNARR